MAESLHWRLWESRLFNATVAARSCAHPQCRRCLGGLGGNSFNTVGSRLPSDTFFGVRRNKQRGGKVLQDRPSADDASDSQTNVNTGECHIAL
jgi:hypothetical protein